MTRMAFPTASGIGPFYSGLITMDIGLSELLLEKERKLAGLTQ